MAHITEFVENGALQCGSVNHPEEITRDTMYFLEEKNGFMAFGCRICTEIHGRPQLHFLTVNEDARRIHAGTRKVEHIDRNPDTGQILSFR